MRRSWIVWLVFLCVGVFLAYLFSQQRLQNLLFRSHRGDERIYANVKEMPWQAVVKLRSGNSRCSGTMVAPDLVVTAAHCVVGNKGEGIFILSEYLNGGKKPVAKVQKIWLDKNYVADKGKRRDIDLVQLSRDWALLKVSPSLDLAEYAVPRAPFLPPPYDVLQGGYGQDSAGGLRMDSDCRVFEHDSRGGIYLLRHNCLISGGDSGGPLFIQRDNKWFLVGINIAVLDVGGRVGGYGVSLEGVLHQLK